MMSIFQQGKILCNEVMRFHEFQPEAWQWGRCRGGICKLISESGLNGSHGFYQSIQEILTEHFLCGRQPPPFASIQK